MKLLFTILMLISTLFFTLGCSDSKPDRLIVSYTNDLNDSNPNDFIIPTNEDLQINVFANYDDGSQTNITDSLTWSLDESLATVEKGLVSAKELTGSVVISYATKEKLSDGSPVHSNTIRLSIEELILEAITLSPTTLDISVGTSQSIIATGIFENDITSIITNNCDWNSSNDSIATVEKGLITGLTEGNATITASYKDKNQTLIVGVEKVLYTTLSIQATKTEFNVKQTIQLEASATNDRNENVVLNNSNVTWDSDKHEIITINDNGLATAHAKGSAIITATITDSDDKDIITLNVIKDKYVRIYKDGEEVEFPYASTTYYEKLPTDFSEFKIIAVGQEFTINDLNVTDLNGTVSVSGEFEGLENGDVIYQDDNTTFVLIHDGSEEKLGYFFKINDIAGSTFNAKYYETAN